MATNVNLKATWIFELDPKDTRLVLRALGGRLKDEEVEEARELGDKLTRLRAAASKALAESMAKHEDHIEEP